MIFLAENIGAVADKIVFGQILTLGNISNVFGILSFILTIVLLFRSEAIRKELNSQRTDYQKEQKVIRNNIVALRNNVRIDGLMDLRIVSEVRTYLLSFKQRFTRLLTFEDKRHMKTTLKILKSNIDEIDKTVLCAELDYFVARFDKKEVK